jgi:hypothetical protein
MSSHCTNYLTAGFARKTFRLIIAAGESPRGQVFSGALAATKSSAAEFMQ